MYCNATMGITHLAISDIKVEFTPPIGVGPLIADFDNDGLRDIFISNGYLKDITDLDFVTYNQDVTMFGSDSLKMKNAAKALKELGGVFKPDFMFRNKGDF